MKRLKVGMGFFAASLIVSGFFMWPTLRDNFITSPIQSESATAIQKTAPALLRPAEEKKILSGIPKHISIPDVGIALPIIFGGPTDSTSSNWILSKDKVHFDTTRPEVNNEKGAAFLYGHNSRPVLGNTDGIEIGAKMIIATENELVFEYELASMVDVDPTNLSAIDEPGDPRVLLLTCSGSFNQARRLMEFKLTKAVEV